MLSLDRSSARRPSLSFSFSWSLLAEESLILAVGWGNDQSILTKARDNFFIYPIPFSRCTLFLKKGIPRTIGFFLDANSEENSEFSVSGTTPSEEGRWPATANLSGTSLLVGENRIDHSTRRTISGLTPTGHVPNCLDSTLKLSKKEVGLS